MADDGMIHTPPDAAREYFHHGCPPGPATEAVANLRPQGVLGVGGPAAARRTARPSLLVRAQDDRCVDAEWLTWAAKALTGRDPAVIGGGHSPFLSRTAELADMLDRFASDVG